MMANMYLSDWQFCQVRGLQIFIALRIEFILNYRVVTTLKMLRIAHNAKIMEKPFQ